MDAPPPPQGCSAEKWERHLAKEARDAERTRRLAPIRYARGYAWGFAGKPEPELAPADWTTGFVDGVAAALAILHEDSLR